MSIQSAGPLSVQSIWSVNASRFVTAIRYAIAVYAGLRRREIEQLRWADVEFSRHWITVAKSKSQAGTGRRVPLAEPLEQLLLKSADRHRSAPGARVARVSVMSGKLAERATSGWAEAGLQRITLHECRHTFASMLMAAGYTIKEIMVFMGHADVQTVQRYIKLLPPRDERNPGDRLDAYLVASGV
jgi:integrase